MKVLENLDEPDDDAILLFMEEKSRMLGKCAICITKEFWVNPSYDEEKINKDVFWTVWSQDMSHVSKLNDIYACMTELERRVDIERERETHTEDNKGE